MTISSTPSTAKLANQIAYAQLKISVTNASVDILCSGAHASSAPSLRESMARALAAAQGPQAPSFHAQTARV